MSKFCQICLKTGLKGNQISRGIGDRVRRRTIIKQEPNLFNKRMKIGGTFMRIRICSSCLKRLKYEQNLLETEKVATPVEAQA